MDNQDTYIVELKYNKSHIHGEKYLITGLKKLNELLNLVSTSKGYILISINNIGKIRNHADLIIDLTEEQKPKGLHW